MTGRTLAGLLLALLVAGPLLAADDPKLPDAKAFDKLVVDTLRDVHNKGADLYNTTKDFAGTYRMYQGALVTVRPLLPHHPAAQKMIDEALAAAEKETSVAQKAFKLHEAIEDVRAHLKGEPAKTPKDPKEPKKPVEVAPVPKEKPEGKPEGKNPGAGGGPGFRGRVTLKGQPLAAGDVILVSLDQPKPRVITAAIQGDGQYAPGEAVPPGRYAVIVIGKGVPEKYQLTTTSGIEIDVKPPPGVYDIELK